MEKIILDTNFLMIPLQFRVDIFSELDRICIFSYKLFIFEQTIEELRSIIEKDSAHKRAAQFALKLIGIKNIGIMKSEKREVDSLILENAAKGYIIATQDINLRKELLKKGVSVIILRQKKYLEFVERNLYK
mgnify:CR=1 FL=1